ncbi:MAG: hypothetical protein ACP5HU_03085 [Phycisphaerae bacterium]
MFAYDLSAIGGVLRAQLSPSDRLNALRDMSTPAGSWWAWGLALAAGGLVLLTVVSLLYYRAERKKRAWRAFQGLCGQTGLSDRERQVLKLLCAVARVKKPEVIFTSEPTFDYAINAIQTDKRFMSRPQAERNELLATCERIREKLGFCQSMDSAVESEGVSRKIIPGAKLSIIHRGKASGFDAVVDHADPSDLLVSPTVPVECKPGESWLVRYSREGKVWEFDATVSEHSNGKIRLSHMERARYINRRRFRRVPTDKAALASAYPFATTGQLTAPQFVPCRMTEIAGCGLRLRGPVSARVGERVLVVMQMEQDKTIQGFGRVRRILSPGNDGEADIALELVGLSEPEVDELVRYTNEAERRQKSDKQEQQPEPAEAPVGATA